MPAFRGLGHCSCEVGGRPEQGGGEGVREGSDDDGYGREVEEASRHRLAITVWVILGSLLGVWSMLECTHWERYTHHFQGFAHLA